MGLVVHLHSHTRRKEWSANLFSHANQNQPAYDKENDEKKHEKEANLVNIWFEEKFKEKRIYLY